MTHASHRARLVRQMESVHSRSPWNHSRPWRGRRSRLARSRLHRARAAGDGLAADRDGIVSARRRPLLLGVTLRRMAANAILAACSDQPCAEHDGGRARGCRATAGRGGTSGRLAEDILSRRT